MKKILLVLVMLVVASAIFAQSVWVEYQLPDEWFEEIYLTQLDRSLRQVPTVTYAENLQDANIVMTVSIMMTRNRAGDVTGYAQAVALLTEKYPERLWATVMLVDNSVEGIRQLAKWAAEYALE